MRPNRGFSLVELVVTVAVLGIIAGIAFPNMREMILNGRVTTQTNELVAALNFARSEAIKRGSEVSVCATDGAGLAGGWRIIPDANCAGAAAPLVRHEALGDVVIEPKNVAAVRFTSRGGLVGGGPVVMLLTPKDCPASSDRAREVSILGSGRIAVGRKPC